MIGCLELIKSSNSEIPQGIWSILPTGRLITHNSAKDTTNNIEFAGQRSVSLFEMVGGVVIVKL